MVLLSPSRNEIQSSLLKPALELKKLGMAWFLPSESLKMQISVLMHPAGRCRAKGAGILWLAFLMRSIGQKASILEGGIL